MCTEVLHACVSLHHACACAWYPERPEEAMGPLRAAPVGAGVQAQSSRRAASGLEHRVVSLAQSCISVVANDPESGPVPSSIPRGQRFN